MSKSYSYKNFILILSFLLFIILIYSCKNNDQDSSKKVQPKTIGVMTYVSHEVLNSIETGLIERLLELGYSKKDIRVINANGEMDKVHAFAKEMVSANYSVLVPITTPVSQAIIKSAQGKVPVVYSFVSDPSSIGVDPNTNKAPHNVTGISDIVNYEGNLNLIRQFLPKAKTIGIIYNASESNSMIGVVECRKLSPTFGFKLEEISVASTSEILNAARLLIDKVDAFYIGGDNTVVSGASAIIKVAREKKIPVFASDIGSVKGGAVIALSVEYKSFGKRTADLVDRVLKGESPNDIPPKKYLGDYLVINRESLKICGLKVPKESEMLIKEEY